MVDLVQTFLDVVVPPTAVLFLALVWPVLAFFKATKWFSTLFFHEDVRGKVVLITGASSGIGEHMVYEYAKRGARLVLVARREKLLSDVGNRALAKGAADVRTIVADVSHEDQCKRFVEETINTYGRLDHLVNNAGVAHSYLFEEAKDTSGMRTVMDITFWGELYPTYYALPHLRRSRGKIMTTASVVSYIPYPRQSIYNSAKAAVVQFYDTLRVELGNAVGITIVFPGWIESEMTKGKFVTDRGELKVDPEQRDLHVGPFPIAYAEECAKAAVSGTIRGKRYVQYPMWYSVFLLYRLLAPEMMDWPAYLFYVGPQPKKPLSKKVMEVTKAERVLYPSSVQKTE